MRRIAIATLVVLGMTVAPCFAARWRTPLLPTTDEVRDIAEQYVEGLPGSTTPEHVEQARAEFIWNFLDGFAHSDSAISSDNDAITKGFEAGQNYRRLNPEKLAKTMAGFGYTPISMRGTWQTDFELSGFVPQAQPSAKWWLSILGDSPASRSNVSPEECNLVQIAGFLSPTGQYGHMGGFTREVFVNEISCVEGANKSFKPNPLRGSA